MKKLILLFIVALVLSGITITDKAHRMATTVKTFDFNGSPQGFYNADADKVPWTQGLERYTKYSLTGGKDGTGGFVPADAITLGLSDVRWTGTWQDLGVPKGVKITDVNLSLEVYDYISPLNAWIIAGNNGSILGDTVMKFQESFASGVEEWITHDLNQVWSANENYSDGFITIYLLLRPGDGAMDNLVVTVTHEDLPNHVQKAFNFTDSDEGWTATTLTGSYNILARRDINDIIDDSADYIFISEPAYKDVGRGYQHGLQAQSNDSTASTGYFEWTGTWEDLGVPENSTVVSILSDLSRFTLGEGETSGASDTWDASLELRDSGGSLTETLISSFTPSGDGFAVERLSADVTIDEPSNTTIKLRLNMNHTAGSTADTILHADDLRFFIKYESAPKLLPFVIKT